MRAHPIGIIVVALVACGAPQRAATTDFCTGSPDVCPRTTGERISPEAVAAQQGNATSEQTKARSATPLTRGARTEEPTGRAREVPAPPAPNPKEAHGLARPFVVPHPANTGDPCGFCR